MAAKRKVYINYLIFLLCLIPYLAATYYLFYHQCVGKFPSDIYYYITVSKQITKNSLFPSLPYPLLPYLARAISLFTFPENAMALAVTLLNGLTAIALKLCIDRCFEGREPKEPLNGISSALLTFSLLFVSMLYPLTYIGRYQEMTPDGAGFLIRYTGVFSPNPYHNATFLAARGFSVITFFLFAEILSFYETENRWYHSKYFMFSVSLFVTTLAKPSFTLVLAGTAGLIMLWRLAKSRFANRKPFFQFGIYFIPTFLLLLFQYGGMFGAEPEQENGIGIGFLKAWSTVSDNVPVSILLGMAFPLTVLFFQLLKRPVSQNGQDSTAYLKGLLRLSWQFFLVALVTVLFFYEKNYRINHLNFAWGYMYGMLFCYTSGLILLVQNTRKKLQPRWQLAAQWIFYGMHLVCGADYFRVLIQGGEYI